MRQVREVLRLKHVRGHGGHQIAAMVGVSRYTVAEYLRRAAVVGITWPVPAGLDDAALERKLFSPPFAAEPSRPQPDWPYVHAGLRRPGVTLQLVWEEYRAGQPEGYGYSRFCDLHAAWRGRLSPTMSGKPLGLTRQTHPAGERLFVDYAGQTVDVICAASGEVRAAQVFVAALGASNLTYAEAFGTQSLPDWIGCHVGAFAFFGGVARQIVCDNLKSGVTATCRYEPGISRTYQDMATHYGTAVLPGRVRRPRDKAKVEVAVPPPTAPPSAASQTDRQVAMVQRWTLARLRNRRFFCLAELNAAIRGLTMDLNDRTMRHLGTSRRAMFEAMERSALLALPSESYAYAEWKRCRVGLDYHVEVHGHFYSVPCRLVREVVEARITDRTIELFHGGTRVASHLRNPRQHRHTTTPEHMPSAHRRYAEWTPTRLLREAAAVGPATIALVERILTTKPLPEQGFRACPRSAPPIAALQTDRKSDGILHLARTYGPERLEAACERGMDIGARSYGSVLSILRHGLDQAHCPDPVPDELPVQHGNIRGGGCYH